ncbi:MAG: tetratricopeptide repeat protein [Bacteroidetes bacterium]|nr:tetratricopeptide repeat protein [Bacteroidota bacterium]
MKNFLLLIFLFIAPLFVKAQDSIPGKNNSTDEQLAAQYYAEGDYEKAEVYYEKLYNRTPINVYYDYYLNCLLYTKDFKKAEKTVKKQSSRNPGDLTFHVDLGRVYGAEGDSAKEKKEFMNGVNAVDASYSANAVIDLANAFLGVNEPDFAIKALLQGRKVLKDVYTFNVELADVYAIKKDYVSMVNEYLDMLTINVAYKQQVQNRLQAKLDADENDLIAPVLKTELIRRAQKNPDEMIWSEMLIWFYMQQKNFPAALIQAKAIDKRKKLDGSDILALAATARANGDYETAEDAYDYVIGLGKNGFNYREARIEKINTEYQKITVGGNYTQDEIISLQSEMNSTLDELGRDVKTVELIRTLAHLQAFYLFDTKNSIKMLEDALTITGLSPMQVAQVKLELGDVLLLDGQVWEASLRYSQVEKAFEYDPIGQEAKYRNAKIAFYIGDFKWAQVQLDVLKSATSKLISNDAMYLSILITENLALDSNPDPLMKFAHADLMIFQNRYDIAILDLDSIDKLYPTHALEDDVLHLRYQIAYKQQKWTEAAGYLEKIISNYGTDILGDDATFELAQLYDTKLNDKAKAMEYYQDVFTNYPGSTFATDARKRFRELRGDKISQ